MVEQGSKRVFGEGNPTLAKGFLDVAPSFGNEQNTIKWKLFGFSNILTLSIDVLFILGCKCGSCKKNEILKRITLFNFIHLPTRQRIIRNFIMSQISVALE